MPKVEPGGPLGLSLGEATWAPVPSPQSIVAVWGSAVPLSLKVTSLTRIGISNPSKMVMNSIWKRLTASPSTTVLSGPAFTAGATLVTVTSKASLAEAPSSSVTVTVTV